MFSTVLGRKSFLQIRTESQMPFFPRSMSTPVYFVDRETPSLHAIEPPPLTSPIPSGRCRFEYLNEGGANFVFTILPDGDNEIPTRLRRKLLRVRKDLSHVQSAEDQLRALNDSFRDLFPAQNLIQHELISLDRGVLTLLNRELDAIQRPNHRTGDVLPEGDMFGLLVTDMTPLSDEVLLQLKPKWLAQSPDAPSSSKRCRTCALRAQRASVQAQTATDAQETCPLSLVSSDLSERERAVHAITGESCLQNFLMDQAQPVLRQLRSCQLILDPHGVRRVPALDPESNLCKAMTLRDCTFFIKRSGRRVEARLGDLDLKQPERLSRWKKVEEMLITEGWYTNTETKGVWTKEQICQLSR